VATNWQVEINEVRRELEIALIKGMTDAEIAEVMYNCGQRLQFYAQYDLGEFSEV